MVQVTCLFCSQRARQRFFVTPNFQRKRSVRSFRLVNHSPNPMPSAFFVKSCGSLISDRACKPSGFEASFGKPSLCIGNQRDCDARTTRLCRDEELIEFVALYDAKPNGRARRTHYSDAWKCCSKPAHKTLQCTESG